MAVSDYSTNPADNTTLANLSVTDATNVNAVDDLVRQLMADTRGFYDETLLKTGDHTIAGNVVFNGNTAFNGAVDLASATNIPAIRIDLGLEIGTDVQAYSQRLDDLSTTYAEGDLITADNAGVLAPLAIGAAGTVLTSDGTKASWGSAQVQEFHDPTEVGSWRIFGTTLECWGKSAPTPSNGPVTVTFPKVFIRPPAVTDSLIFQSGLGTTGPNTPATTTSIDFAARGGGGGFQGGVEFYWHAIGEWDGIS